MIFSTINGPRGLVANIVNDDDAESPRKWDPLGTIIAWHRRYRIGERDGYKENISPSDFEQEAREGRYLVLPLYMYEHGGVRIRTTTFNDPWDSGQAGYVYVAPEKVRTEYRVKRISSATRERVFDVLRDEVATYSMFLSGETYGVEVVNPAGEIVDASYGFIGWENVQAGAVDLLETQLSISPT